MRNRNGSAVTRANKYSETVGFGHKSASEETALDELAIAIVEQAVKDYVKVIRKLWDKKLTVIQKRNLMIEKAELEGFFHSDWYEFLTDIDPHRLIAQCKVVAKEKEKQAIEKQNKAKIKKLFEEKDGE